MTTPDSESKSGVDLPAGIDQPELPDQVSDLTDASPLAAETVDTEAADTETVKLATGETEAAEAGIGEKRERVRVRSTLTVTDHVRTSLAELNEKREPYAELVKQFAVLLYTSGLGQTLAYLKTLSGPEAGHLARHLSVWALRDRRSAGPDLLEALARRTNSFHEEVLDETLVWLKETNQQLATV